MLRISEATLSKKQCNAGEKITISVEIWEKRSTPCRYPYKFPKYSDGIALPQKTT